MEIAIVSVPVRDQSPGSVKGTVYDVDDLASLRDRLLAVGEVDRQPWGNLAQLDDLDGNGIVLQQSRGSVTV